MSDTFCTWILATTGGVGQCSDRPADWTYSESIRAEDNMSLGEACEYIHIYRLHVQQLTASLYTF
jgi:hypothetical protein